MPPLQEGACAAVGWAPQAGVSRRWLELLWSPAGVNLKIGCTREKRVESQRERKRSCHGRRAYRQSGKIIFFLGDDQLFISLGWSYTVFYLSDISQTCVEVARWLRDSCKMKTKYLKYVLPTLNHLK